MPTRPRSEFVEAYRNQVAALKSSCEAYDQGSNWEAYRLAVAVYALVHDGGRNSTSILTHLGLRSSLRFITSSQSSPALGNEAWPLASMQIGVGEDGEPFVRYLPKLDKAPIDRLLQFPQWWTEELVVKDDHGALTRKQLVFSLRNSEGSGAHIDEKLRPDYHRITRETPEKRRLITSMGHSIPSHGIERAAMRQIAWELLGSLDGVEL